MANHDSAIRIYGHFPFPDNEPAGTAALGIYDDLTASHLNVYVSIRRRYVALHPFQVSQTRTALPLGIARLCGAYTEIVFTQQVDWRCSPSVAERLAVAVAIHGQALGVALLRVVCLPKGGGTLGEHAAPVTAHLAHNLPLPAKGTEGFQFVEAHVGSGNLHHRVVLEDIAEH